MRGSPTWQVVWVIGMFATAAVPVWRLTAPAAPISTARAPVALAGAAVRLEIAVGFTPAPQDFALRYLGETTVLAGQGPTADFTGSWVVHLPPDGVDLTLQARWPETASGHVAAHVTLRFPDGRTTEKTVWGEAGNPLVETLTITP